MTRQQKNGCWRWSGKTIRHGYGMLCANGKNWLIHRLIWTIVNGEIPKGMYVLHRCDQPPCFNPKHLFLGTQSDNMLDAYAKGRVPTPVGRRNILHCPSGHPYDEINTGKKHLFAKGKMRVYRYCKTCKRGHDKKRIATPRPGG